MRFIVTFMTASLLAVGLFGSVSEASLLNSLLSFDGVVDRIDDDSRALIFDNNTNDILDTGDDIVGLIRLEAFGTIGGVSLVPTDNLIFAFFGIRVSGSPALGVLDHTAVPILSPNSLKSLLSPDLVPGGFVFSGDEFFAIVEKKSAVPGDNPFNSDTSPFTEIAAITAASGWSLDAIGNFDGVDDFFQTSFALVPGSADFGVLDTGGPFGMGAPDTIIQISEIIADTNGIEVLQERAAFSLEFHNLGVPLLSLSALKFSGGSGSGDIVLKPTGGVQTTELMNSHVEDDSNFRINPVPEPTSLVIWGLLGVAFGATAWWKRRLRG